MINLLPPYDHHQLAAARTNSLLRRYVILMALFIVVLTLEMFAFRVAISAENDHNNQIIAENATKTADFASVKVRATQFRSDLAAAKYILDQQVPYTAIFMKIAAALPDDMVLDSLSINPETFGTPTTLTARTKSFQRATDGKNQLQASGAFSDISIQSTTQVDGATSGYSYTVIYNVTFSRELLKL
jgi:Tfp pilus assembly protein PilN